MKKAISSYKAKTLREDVHSHELKYVACATAPGTRVSQAKLFVIERIRCKHPCNENPLLPEKGTMDLYSIKTWRKIHKSRGRGYDIVRIVILGCENVEGW